MARKKSKKIEVPFRRVFLESQNDVLPSKVLDKKTLRKLRKLSLVRRNKILQENLARIKRSGMKRK